MKIIVASFLALLLSGCCGTIYSYELEDISKKCGGVDKIHSMWVDLTTVRARCINGQMVDSKD